MSRALLTGSYSRLLLTIFFTQVANHPSPWPLNVSRPSLTISSHLVLAECLPCRSPATIFTSKVNKLTRGNHDSTQKNPDDVVITLALRTPLTKAKRGGFKDTPLDYIVYSLLKEVVARSKLDPKLIDDVCMGNVRQTSTYSMGGNADVG